MKIINNLVWVLCLLAVISGCGYTNLATDNSNSSSSNKKPSLPNNFKVIYTSGSNELNSVQNYIKKDLGLDGFAKATYFLSFEEESRIYDIVKDVDLTRFPDQLGMINSLGEKSLWIVYDSTEKKINWDIPGEPKTKQEEILEELGKVLDDILYNNSVYRSLPKAHGGRL